MKTLGILGGGQLGRMLALAAQPLGVRVTVVDPDPDAPAQTAAEHVPLPFDDWDALDELALQDVVTFEFENVPDESVRRLEAKRKVFPPPEALIQSQDRLTEKTLFRRLGIPTPQFLEVSCAADALTAWKALGPFLLKTRRFGYDGKGQVLVKDEASAEAAHGALGGVPCIAEELIRFERELSVIVCRGQDGQMVTYPLTENSHASGILRRSIAPAPGISAETTRMATEYGHALASELKYVGVLALELFDVGGKLLANEFAPRVHNSGHWTIEGARTSQFENHVRAVLGWPLGATDALGPAAMVNLIGSVPDAGKVLALVDTHLHDYAKEPRAGRKVGHITVRAADYAELSNRIRAIEALLG